MASSEPPDKQESRWLNSPTAAGGDDADEHTGRKEKKRLLMMKKHKNWNRDEADSIWVQNEMSHQLKTDDWYEIYQFKVIFFSLFLHVFSETELLC